MDDPHGLTLDLPADGGRKKRQKFTADDDARLRLLVAELKNDWRGIATAMPGRNARQVRDRWVNYLAPGVNARPWSESEDAMLIEKERDLGHCWHKIAEYFPGRTEINVRSRFQLVARHRQKGIGVHYPRRELDAPASGPPTPMVPISAQPLVWPVAWIGL